MRAGDVVQRLFARRDPNKDTYLRIADAMGYRSTGSITDLLRRDDMHVSTLYKLCKYFGYVILIMKPDDPTGKSDMVITMKPAPLPLMNDKGEPIKGRPRHRKMRRPTQYDRYKSKPAPITKPVVPKICRVKKKKEESDNVTEVLKHEDQGSTF